MQSIQLRNLADGRVLTESPEAEDSGSAEDTTQFVLGPGHSTALLLRAAAGADCALGSVSGVVRAVGTRNTDNAMELPFSCTVVTRSGSGAVALGCCLCLASPSRLCRV
jgi:hypothetical protein